MDAGRDGLPGHHALSNVEQESSGGSDPVTDPNLRTAVETVKARILKCENVTKSPVEQVRSLGFLTIHIQTNGFFD